MPGYIIVDVQVTDPEAYERYKAAVPATLAAYGGKFVVRGGRAENLEGDWQPNRIVVLEFDSVARAKAWWDSQEYAAPKRLRQSASVTRMILVEGAASAPAAEGSAKQ
jgi:uncharacterized protein (DUF1330 family)